MKWSKPRPGEMFSVSNTTPAYKVAHYIVDGVSRFRCSFKGEFIGRVTDDKNEAKQICERHNTITQEAKEITDGPKATA